MRMCFEQKYSLLILYLRVQVAQYIGGNGEIVSHLNITAVHSNDGGLYRYVKA